MKRLLIALAALALLAGPASAAKLLRQNSDGTACWYNNVDGTCPPAGEHMFSVEIPDITAASTHYITIPYAGRLRSASVVLEATIGGASEVIEFYISRPASIGDVGITDGAGFNAFQPVTPNVTEAATGKYELHAGLAYASTGQVGTVDFVGLGSTTASFVKNSVIAIYNLGLPTLANVVTTDHQAYVTIVVH